jgi:hypothetical protein
LQFFRKALHVPPDKVRVDDFPLLDDHISTIGLNSACFHQKSIEGERPRLPYGTHARILT